MVMTIIVGNGATLGPYQSGSVLKVSVPVAQQIIQQYGQNLNIQSSAPSGTNWFQDGISLTVYPRLLGGQKRVRFNRKAYIYYM